MLWFLMFLILFLIIIIYNIFLYLALIHFSFSSTLKKQIFVFYFGFIQLPKMLPIYYYYILYSFIID